MGRDPLSGSYHKDCCIKNRQNPFGFCHEINMSRCIHQDERISIHCDTAHFRCNCDSSCSFLRIRVKKCSPMINTACFLLLAGSHQQLFDQGGLSCIHVRQDSNGILLHLRL